MESRSHAPQYRPTPDPYAGARCNALGGSCPHFRSSHGPNPLFPQARPGCWYQPEGCGCALDWSGDVAG